MQMSLSFSPSRAEMEAAFVAKDASYDGLFFVAVRTTGIFCRPSCPSRPRRKDIEFFASLKDAVFAGYRPCQRCRPAESLGQPPAWVNQLMQRGDTAPGHKLSTADWQALGITPDQARRWFKDHYGMTFTDWCRARRLAHAFTQIRADESMDDGVLANGDDSHSGFRDAFAQTFGVPPGHPQTQDYIAVQLIASPLGLMLSGAVDRGVCLLEFTDRRGLKRHYETIRQCLSLPVFPVSHPHLVTLRKELASYFSGHLTHFSVPIAPPGTPFQATVWQELQRIPPGETVAYDELASRIGQPTAMRAVARANGQNRISILIPCHRVIGKDGSLTGYGGGLWRKRLLLELERTGKLPGD